MEKRKAFILSLIFTLLLFTVLQFFQQKKILEEASVKRIIDGDTLELEDGRKLRFLNINSPERGSHGHEQAADFLSPLLNQTVEIEIVETDRYNRILARVYTPEYLNLELVRRGFASKFLVQENEIKEFSKAENSAINSERGIWKKSRFYDCFKIEILPEKEQVLINNKCTSLNIQGWKLKDESTREYEFTLKTINKITLHSNEGKDNRTDIFWNSKTNIWNNDRDTLYLFDTEGNLVHYETYGY